MVLDSRADYTFLMLDISLAVAQELPGIDSLAAALRACTKHRISSLHPLSKSSKSLAFKSVTGWPFLSQVTKLTCASRVAVRRVKPAAHADRGGTALLHAQVAVHVHHNGIALNLECATNLVRGCCTRDGGRSTVIGLQERVTNRRMLLDGRPNGSERFG